MVKVNRNGNTTTYFLSTLLTMPVRPSVIIEQVINVCDETLTLEIQKLMFVWICEFLLVHGMVLL
jgi:hypothetical protein